MNKNAKASKPAPTRDLNSPSNVGFKLIESVFRFQGALDGRSKFKFPEIKALRATNKAIRAMADEKAPFKGVRVQGSGLAARLQYHLVADVAKMSELEALHLEGPVLIDRHIFGRLNLSKLSQPTLWGIRNVGKPAKSLDINMFPKLESFAYFVEDQAPSEMFDPQKPPLQPSMKKFKFQPSFSATAEKIALYLTTWFPKFEEIELLTGMNSYSVCEGFAELFEENYEVRRSEGPLWPRLRRFKLVLDQSGTELREEARDYLYSTLAHGKDKFPLLEEFIFALADPDMNYTLSETDVFRKAAEEGRMPSIKKIVIEYKVYDEDGGIRDVQAEKWSGNEPFEDY